MSSSRGRGTFAEVIEASTRRQVARERSRFVSDERERAEAWITEHTPELDGNALVLGCVMVRLGHPSLTAQAVRARYEAGP